ncbi:DDT domain-containing protein DDB_G0282237 isoform X2 [Phalaenopsis equestris]|uniref:DDT domain-containing protein DDB_G0282237 isoform X2 n=1 Tax=Phalaenopsis equestris TaxID=78828 RepID=UPI0009E51EAD|nr:DDT domain-containing protein DDB_G0282237 isoform X2 [Phalaenopsis equestris]
MPLYKRKPYLLADPPKDLDPNELVYQIRFTKEIFRDYQEYLNRLNLYRRRLWTCKVTGKINLTYEEALVSEHNATERVQQFPGELVPHVLNMIQYSSLNLTDLINEIHKNLQKNLYEGIELHAKKGESVCACKIIEIIKDGEVTRCKVGWLDKERQVTDVSVVSEEDLIRKKPPLSRSILKAFIRESTCQISPWLVHEKFAKKHGISTDKLTCQNGVLDISKDRKRGGTKNKLDNQNLKPNQKKRKTENGHVSDNRVEEPIIYPIDDLLVKPSADDPNFTDRPLPSTDFNVPMDCVGDLLMFWNFFTSFGRFLHLWPFSLEDFENAICHKHSEVMLILESHSAILKLLIKDGGDYYVAIQNKRKKLKVKLTNWANYLCHFLEMRNKPELSDHIPIIKRGHYGLLEVHVKLGILRELVAEALVTNAIRDWLNECIEQKKVLLARKREEVKTKKDQHHRKEGENHTEEMNLKHMLVNGKGNYVNLSMGSAPKYSNGYLKANGRIQSADRKLIMENGESPLRIENKDGENQDKISINEQREHFEREVEKLSIRTNCIGKDRNYSMYWFFRREGRLFVESSDSNKWGYYSTKEELDALIGSLNEKGERERDLKRQLEKYYVKISTALQKRSKDIAQKILIDESELRRSTRVKSLPRCSPAMTFHKYINRWKEKPKASKRHKKDHVVNLDFIRKSHVLVSNHL